MATLLTSATALAATVDIDLTAGAGNRALAVWCHIEDPADILPNGADIEGVQLLTGPTPAENGDNEGRWFYLLESEMPGNATARTITVTFTATPGDVQVHALLFDGVGQGAPLTTVTTATSATTISPNITTTKDNAVVCTAAGLGNLQTVSTTYGDASLAQVTDGSSGSRVAYELDAGVAAAESITWTAGGTVNRMVASSIAFQAAEAADPTAPSSVTMATIHGAGRFDDLQTAAGYTESTNTLTATGTAADAVGVARVEVQIGNLAPVVATGTTSWSAAVVLDDLGPGEHTATATAYDAANNQTSTTQQVWNTPDGAFAYTASGHMMPIKAQVTS